MCGGKRLYRNRLGRRHLIRPPEQRALHRDRVRRHRGHQAHGAEGAAPDRSGSVSADLNGEVWNVGVETGSGDVTLKMPPTIGAEVDIETSSGDIETDFEVAVTRHARDHMTGRIGDGRGKIAIETGSGGIKLVKAGSVGGQLSS